MYLLDFDKHFELGLRSTQSIQPRTACQQVGHALTFKKRLQTTMGFSSPSADNQRDEQAHEELRYLPEMIDALRNGDDLCGRFNWIHHNTHRTEESLLKHRNHDSCSTKVGRK